MAGGNGFDSFAAIANVPRQYLYMWLRDFPEFAYAKLVAEPKYMKWWEDQGKNGIQNQSFNSSTWIFNMKNRFNWYDRNVTHVFPIQLEKTLEILACDDSSRVKALPDVPEMRVRDHIETLPAGT